MKVTIGLIIFFSVFCTITGYDIYEKYSLSQIPKICQEKYFQTHEVVDKNFINLIEKKINRKEFLKSSKLSILQFKKYFLKMRIKKNYFKILVENLRKKISIEYWKNHTEKESKTKQIHEPILKETNNKNKNAIENEINKVTFMKSTYHFS